MVSIDTFLSRPREVVTFLITLVVLVAIGIHTDKRGAAIGLGAIFLVGVLLFAPFQFVIESHYWFWPLIGFLVFGLHRFSER